MREPIPVPSAPPDLDALRQRQHIRQGLGHADINIESALEDIDTLLARLDAQQQDIDKLEDESNQRGANLIRRERELVTLQQQVERERQHQNAEMGRAEEAYQKVRQRLDAVTAERDLLHRAMNALVRNGIVIPDQQLAAVLTGTSNAELDKL